jgi:hypothetical protein
MAAAQLTGTAATVSSYFDAFHFIVYLFFVLVGMIVYYQWKWTNDLKKNIRLLIVRAGGGGSFDLAPIDGGSVTVTNPDTGLSRTWPVNELATIDVPYPGDAFIPMIFQKRIRMAIVSEEDWEPLLNRSPHHTRVASPDVIQSLEEIAQNVLQIFADKPEVAQAMADEIRGLVDDTYTGPTREMIASPAVLGNLKKESVTAALATINKEVFDKLDGLFKRLNTMINPTIVYVLLIVSIVASVGVGIFVFKTQADSKSAGGDVNVTKQMDSLNLQLQTIQQTLSVIQQRQNAIPTK